MCSTDYYTLKVFSKYPHLSLYTFDGTRILSMLNSPIVSVGVDANEVAQTSIEVITKETTDDVIIPYEFRFKPFWTKN